MSNFIILSHNKALVELITAVVKTRVPQLDRNLLYTAEEVLIEVWDLFEKSEHLLLGRILKALAYTNQLPLNCVGKTSQNWQLFQVA